MEQTIAGLKKLREPFPDHQISKLPKPTKQQTDEVKANFQAGVRCKECNGWHHPKVVHLDYVGHAALTDRLLDADPTWNWEPLSLSPEGFPALDKKGGLWIKLTVCGVTRLGYGTCDKDTMDTNKELIGDALRNAAMRFGAALELWHKGDLHLDEPVAAEPPKEQPPTAEKAQLKNHAPINAAQAKTLFERSELKAIKQEKLREILRGLYGIEATKDMKVYQYDDILKLMATKTVDEIGIEIVTRQAEREQPSAKK